MASRTAHCWTGFHTYYEGCCGAGAGAGPACWSEAYPFEACCNIELAVYEALPRRGSRTVDEIAVAAGLPVSDVLGPLTMLDVRGLVTQVDGCWKLAKR